MTQKEFGYQMQDSVLTMFSRFKSRGQGFAMVSFREDLGSQT